MQCAEYQSYKVPAQSLVITKHKPLMNIENVTTAVIWYDLLYPCPITDIKVTENRISLPNMSYSRRQYNKNFILCKLFHWVPCMKIGNLSTCVGSPRANTRTSCVLYGHLILTLAGDELLWELSPNVLPCWRRNQSEELENNA
jgi:hypothetical protein